ncbi:hypothetical protein RvY_11811-3 [Ramazzottius varieornatus]|uniref:DNA-directed RNA polymerase n=1 Tax=Ramazzottius varieornatus TaxID=947166 RepID=A0A1D1VMQ9_RAMVA|nr:hypothetical protein RvY_11811-3 [Ramazzottius varieornatus]
MPSAHISRRFCKKHLNDTIEDVEDRENVSPHLLALRDARISPETPNFDLSEDDDFPADFDNDERECKHDCLIIFQFHCGLLVLPSMMSLLFAGCASPLCIGLRDAEAVFEDEIRPSNEWKKKRKKTYVDEESVGLRVFAEDPEENRQHLFEEVELDYSSHEWDKAVWRLINLFFHDNALVQQQLDSFNQFWEYEVQKIIEESPPVDVRKEEAKIKGGKDEVVKLSYKFKHAFFCQKPEAPEADSFLRTVTPQVCRLRNFTYGIRLYIDVEETTVFGNSTKPPSKKREKVFCGWVPVMVRSKKCMLVGLNEREVCQMDECYNDPGGYFIVDGSEKVVIAQERSASNTVFVFPPPNNCKFTYRAEIRSVAEKPPFTVRDFSVLVSKRATGASKAMEATYGSGRPITAILPYIKQEIPIGVLFRALGCLTDREITAHITFDLNDDEMANWLSASIAHSSVISTQEVALNFIAVRGVKPGVTKAQRLDYARNLLRKDFLPHIGDRFFHGSSLRKCCLQKIHNGSIFLEQRKMSHQLYH